MILAPVIAVAGVRQALRGTAIGTVFVGAGAGVIGLSLLLPYFIESGPSKGWIFTSILVLICTILAWAGLSPRIKTDQPTIDDTQVPAGRKVMWIFFLAYLLAAVGIVPHSIYLSAYVHEALDQPVAFSTMVYAIYGAGVLVGGPLFGLLSNIIGTRLSLAASSLTGLIAVLIVLVTTDLWFVVASGAILGAAQMGIATCTTHLVMELVGPARHTRWWGRLTIGFNIGQASGALAMGVMIHVHWGYLAGFWMAAGCLLASAILTLFVRTTNQHAIGTQS
jgi:predicted MFS family arabinose efflux permease